MVSAWLDFLGTERHCYNTLLDKDMLKFIRLLIEPNLTLAKALLHLAKSNQLLVMQRCHCFPKEILNRACRRD